MESDVQFGGKTAVITGGATGIGKALARQLANEGMKVVIASTNAERLNAAAEQLDAAGGNIVPMVCDVTDREAVRALAARVEEDFGGTDVLCANAGGSTTGPLLEHGDGDWDWVIDVVFRGVTNCIQAFYPGMARRGSGSILITGSHTGCAPDMMSSRLTPIACARSSLASARGDSTPASRRRNAASSKMVIPRLRRRDGSPGPRSLAHR